MKVARNIMKKLSIFLSILLILTQFSIEVAADTEKNTIYVDDDNALGPWDGSLAHPYQFIQEGIDAAGYGDTVFVYGGFYNEQIIIDKTITLQGESRENTIIDGTGLGRLCTIQETNNVMVSGFTFQNVENDAEALYITYSTSCIIEQNRFIQNKGLSIFLGGSNNVVQENEILDNFCESNTIWVTSLDSTLLNNTIKNNMGNAISVFAKNNIITGNIIENNEKNGIDIIDYPSIVNICISGNLIQGNNVGITVAGKTSCHLITHNIISGNKKYGIKFQLLGESTISYNIFEDNPIGLFQYCTADNIILHNTFDSNFIGLQNFGTTYNSYNENNFIKNTIHASFFDHVPRSLYPEGYVFDSWDHNYWDNWKIGLPKPIFGLYCVVLPYCYFDKNPATEPFDIEAEN